MTAFHVSHVIHSSASPAGLISMKQYKVKKTGFRVRQAEVCILALLLPCCAILRLLSLFTVCFLICRMELKNSLKKVLGAYKTMQST